MKNWLKPTLTTISMNAEIGGYQAEEERPEEPMPRDGDAAPHGLDLAEDRPASAARQPGPGTVP
jgi:hypothetical protein